MAMVSEYEHHIPALNLPDPNDCHVVAAAIATNASVILAWNLRHFPAKELKKFGLRKEIPDAFLLGLYDEVPDLTIGSLANARRNLTRSQISASDFVSVLSNQKLIQLAKRAQRHVAEL